MSDVEDTSSEIISDLIEDECDVTISFSQENGWGCIVERDSIRGISANEDTYNEAIHVAADRFYSNITGTGANVSKPVFMLGSSSVGRA